MADRYTSIEATPGRGGALMTGISSENAGVFNYVAKRDWRRVLDHEMRAEGYDHFRPNITKALGNQPFPGAPTTDPILLIHMARRPNGETAIIAATATTIYRYFALEDGAYFEGNGTPAAYFEEPPLPDTPYFDDNPGEWIVIGSGFSPDGNRWEAENLNGYAIFNNGVDLPVTYRLEDFAVRPIWELRDNGVAAVGTIAVFEDVLMLADILQIHDEKLLEIRSPIDSGAITASQAGALYSGLITATAAGATVTADAAFFNAGMVGKDLRFSNGIRRTITAFTDAQNVDVDGDPLAIATGLPFYILETGDADFIVDSSAGFFTADHVGLRIFWDSGHVRTITALNSPTQVVVNSDLEVPSGEFGIENPEAYATFTQTQFIDRIQYRILWSDLDEPRRFDAIVPGTIMAGSNQLTFLVPTRSFESGQAIIILGAGASGGNLLATILFLGENGRDAILDTQALTSVTDADVSAQSSIGSLVGFEDLQDDGSAIIRMRRLRGKLVIYKDTSIFLGQFTGQVDSPFSFQHIYSGSKSVHYKHTLVDVNGLYHLYAGRNTFYRFDLTGQIPQEQKTLEIVKPLFFDAASQENGHLIFAAENVLTKEVFFCFPSMSDDKVLRYDYLMDTVSTSSAAFTAAASVKRPVSGPQIGPSEDWFIMGTAQGTILRYGLVDAEVISPATTTASQSGVTVTASAAVFTTMHVGRTIIFGDDRAVQIVEFIDASNVTVNGPSTTASGMAFRIVGATWNRLGEAYESVLQSGAEAYGSQFSEKDFERYVLILASFSPECSISVDFLGGRNTPEIQLLASTSIATPNRENMVPVYFRENYFSERVRVAGLNAHCKLAARLFNVSGLNSRSAIRRMTEDN